MKQLLTTLLLVLCSGAVSAQDVVRDGYVTTRDGVKLYYQIHGDRGDTIVHLHGGPGGSLSGQLPNLLRLRERHVLISYDQRGGGRSVPVDTLLLTAETHVRDLEDLRAALSIPRMTLYGHSWGVALATMYAAEHPGRVHQLVLNGPMPPARIPFAEQRQTSIADAIKRLCERRAAATDQSRQAYIEQCQAAPRMTSRVYYYDTLHIARNQGASAVGDAITADGMIAQRRTLASLGDWDFRPTMRKVAARTLVVEGEFSPVPLDQVRIWAETLPNARVFLVPRTGHAYPHIENPDVFFPALETFLSGGWPAGSQSHPAIGRRQVSGSGALNKTTACALCAGVLPQRTP